MYSLVQTNPPAIEPVSLLQAKAFAVISPNFTDDDLLLTALITAGRQEAEKYTRRAFYTQTWTLGLDRFPIFWDRSTVKSLGDNWYPYSYFFEGLTIRMPLPKCLAVNTITYYDTQSTQQSLDSSEWFVDYSSEPARVIPATGSYWPTVSIYLPGAVQIGFDCGTYGDGTTTNTIPQPICVAIMMYVSHFYVNREGNVPIPQAFYKLLDGYRHEVFTYSFY